MTTPNNDAKTEIFTRYSASREIHASFGLRADDLIPKEIEALLGIRASQSFARGDKYIGHLDRVTLGERTRSTGTWSTTSEGIITSDDICVHVRYLIGILKPKLPVIREVLSRTGMYGAIWLWIESGETIHSFGLSSGELATIATLCHELNFSVISRMQTSTGKKNREDKNPR